MQDRRQLRIQSRDARPVGIAGRHRFGVTGDDGCLQCIEAARSAQLARSSERLHPASDLKLVPQFAVLIQHEDGLARCVGARSRARIVQFHQSEQSVGFGFVRRNGREHAAHAQRFIAEFRTLPVLAARRAV